MQFKPVLFKSQLYFQGMNGSHVVYPRVLGPRYSVTQGNLRELRGGSRDWRGFCTRSAQAFPLKEVLMWCPPLHPPATHFSAECPSVIWDSAAGYILRAWQKGKSWGPLVNGSFVGFIIRQASSSFSRLPALALGKLLDLSKHHCVIQWQCQNVIKITWLCLNRDWH